MRALYESLLDIDNIETETNITKYLSKDNFQHLYKRKLKIVNIDKSNPICITGNDIPMVNLCRNFSTKSIDMSGVYPDSKIKEMYNFASYCKNLIDFIGPNPHNNYSETESLEWFFDSDLKLKTFDLKGLAKSIKKIKYIGSMFNSCYSIEYIDLSYFDFSFLIGASQAFCDCKNLKRIDMGNSNAVVEDANYMCQSSINLEEFNAPNMILSGDFIFYNCRSLKNINVKYIDVSKNNYNTFYKCEKLENVKIYGLCWNGFSNDLSWAVSLNDKSWDFLFMNLGDGNGVTIKLPDIPKKKILLEKYNSIAKKHNFKLS